MPEAVAVPRGEDTEQLERHAPIRGRHTQLLRGECEATVASADGERECQFNAKYRKITAGGVEDRCGFHTPKSWEIVATRPSARSFDVIPLRTVECHAIVGDGPEKGNPVLRCGDRSFLAFVENGEVQEGYCLQHCRESWVANLDPDE